jgi:PhnB protein
VKLREGRIETMQLHTYLNYGGNCAEAFRFYQEKLGAKIVSSMTYGQMPGAKDLPPEQEKFVLHARLELGGTVLMASDVPADRFEPMRSVYLSLGVESPEEAERLHGILADGGAVFMPMQETFYAHRFSMLRDRFGTNWMVICEKAMG